MDTNTVRVTGRVFGLPVTDNSRRSKFFRKLLEQLMDLNNPREFNFALIDFAAGICKPRNPFHEICPVREFCNLYKTNDKHLHINSKN